MENDDIVQNVRSYSPIPGSLSSTSCAIVFSGVEAQGVSYAVNLLGVLLSGTEPFKDKKGLLICKRSAWDSATNILNRKLTDSFEFGKFPCKHCINDASDGLGGSSALYMLLRHCFGELNCNGTSGDAEHEFIPVNATEPKYPGTHPNPKPFIGATEEHFTKSGGKIQVQGNALKGQNVKMDRKRPCHAMEPQRDHPTAESSIKGQLMREENLRRLLVRFVDEAPTKKIGDHGEELPTDASKICLDPENGPLWNYLQAANEISVHNEEIAVVVIAGLAQMQIKDELARKRSLSEDFKPNPVKDANHAFEAFDTAIPHPFTACGVSPSEGRGTFRRVYHHRYLNTYAMSIAISLKALEVKINNVGYETRGIPGLFLFEASPKDPEDRRKFVSFLRTRFHNL